MVPLRIIYLPGLQLRIHLTKHLQQKRQTKIRSQSKGPRQQKTRLVKRMRRLKRPRAKEAKRNQTQRRRMLWMRTMTPSLTAKKMSMVMEKENRTKGLRRWNQRKDQQLQSRLPKSLRDVATARELRSCSCWCFSLVSLRSFEFSDCWTSCWMALALTLEECLPFEYQIEGQHSSATRSGEKHECQEEDLRSKFLVFRL